MQTELITYSLKDRDREFRGHDRDYQKSDTVIAGIVAAINSGAQQERVKKRDMHGFYGHGVRELFGLIPKECKLINDKWVCIQPAFITTKLKGYKDGTVEHQHEFMENEYGQAVYDLYRNRVGGFSSAIDEYSNPPQWFGFDYVHEPNFSTNRGFTLDGVGDEVSDQQKAFLLLAFEYKQSIAMLHRVISDYEQAQAITLDSVASTEAELDVAKRDLEKAKSRNGIILLEPSSRKATLDSADDFLSLPIEGMEIEGDKRRKEKPKPVTFDNIALNMLESHYKARG